MRAASYLASALALALLARAKPTHVNLHEKRVAGNSHQQEPHCAGWQENCSSKACCNNWRCDPVKKICGPNNIGTTKPKCCDQGKTGCTTDADCCTRGDKCVNNVCTVPPKTRCAQQGLGPECKVSGGCCKSSETCKYGNTCVQPKDKCAGKGPACNVIGGCCNIGYTCKNGNRCFKEDQCAGKGPACAVTGGCCAKGETCKNGNKCTSTGDQCSGKGPACSVLGGCCAKGETCKNGKSCVPEDKCVGKGPACDVSGGCCAKGESCKNGNSCTSGTTTCSGQGPACNVEGGCCPLGKICTAGTNGGQICTACPGQKCPGDDGKASQCCPTDDGHTYTCTKENGVGKCVPDTPQTCEAKCLGSECAKAPGGCCPLNQDCVDPQAGTCCKHFQETCSSSDECCKTGPGQANIICDYFNHPSSGVCVLCSSGTKCLNDDGRSGQCCPNDGTTWTCTTENGIGKCVQQQPQTCDQKGLGQECSGADGGCCPQNQICANAASGTCCKDKNAQCSIDIECCTAGDIGSTRMCSVPASGVGTCQDCPGKKCSGNPGHPGECCPTDGKTYDCTILGNGSGVCQEAVSQTCAQKGFGDECSGAQGGCCPANKMHCSNAATGSCCAETTDANPTCSTDADCCGAGQAGSTKLCSIVFPATVGTCADCPGTKCTGSNGATSQCCPGDGLTYYCIRINNNGVCRKADSSYCGNKGFGQPCDHAPNGCCPVGHTCVDPTTGSCCASDGQVCTGNSECCSSPTMVCGNDVDDPFNLPAFCRTCLHRTCPGADSSKKSQCCLEETGNLQYSCGTDSNGDGICQAVGP